MNKGRIQELADFFYSSRDSKRVPLRISAATGGFTGIDLTKENLIKLLIIINDSTNLKKDLNKFLEDIDDDQE